MLPNNINEKIPIVLSLSLACIIVLKQKFKENQGQGSSIDMYNNDVGKRFMK